MTWLSNSITKVRCDGHEHKGPEVFDVATAYHMSARSALIEDGWGYEHVTGTHICPVCVKRNRLRN